MNHQRAFGLADAALVAGVCLVLFLSAWQFAKTQVIWNDEATQLAGLKLSPADQVRYLMLDQSLYAGVPMDRMPPLSYWAGWAWSQVFGASEMSFRMMGIAAATLACAFVAVGGFMLAGRWGLVGAGLSFAISANVVEIASLIRAYPLFLSFAAIALVSLLCFARGQGRRRHVWLAVMVAASVGAAYSHFFGLTMGGAVLVAAWVTALRQKNSAMIVVASGVLFLVLTAGVWPFALVATSATKAKAESGSFTASSPIRTLYRQVGHPAASVDLPVLGLLGLSFTVLMCLALWRKNEPKDVSAVYDAVPTALAVGLGVTFLAGMVTSLFDVYRPSYSCWVIPGIHLLVATALARTCAAGRVLVVARVATVMLFVAQVWTLGVLLKSPEVFSNGPHEMLAEMIDKHDSDIEVVYESIWQMGYYPLRYEYGPDLKQWALGPVMNTLASWEIQRLPLTEESPMRDLASYPIGQKLILVGCSQHGQSEIRQHLRGEPWQPTTGPLVDWLNHSPEWRLIENRQHFSYIGAYARVYEKVGVDETPNATSVD